MKRISCAIFLLLVGLCLFKSQPVHAEGEGEAAPSAAPLLVQELKVDGESGQRASVLYEVCLPEGVKGYRIVDANGTPARASTISRQGSQVLIHFNAYPGETVRLEALGETVRNTPAVLRNGLLRSAKPYGGKAVQNVNEFWAQWRAAAGTERCRVESQVFSGANPFGKNRNTLTVFNGFINIAEHGLYVFVTASTDASFLLIDGNAVVAAPGHHDVYSTLSGQRQGAVRLAKGEHAFTYCHANSRDDFFAIAAILVGEKRMEVLPASAFTPFLGVTAKTVVGETPPTWKHTATLEIDGHQLREVILGDGRRLFFYDDKMKRLGDYTVVCDHDPAPMPLKPAMQNALIAAACQAVKEEAPTPEGCRFLASALVAYDLEKPALQFLQDMAVNTALADADAMCLCRRMLSERLCGEGERFQEAAAIWRLYAQARGKAFSVECARLLFYGLDDISAAAEALAGLDAETLPAPALQRLRILEADMALQTRGLAEAASLYDEIPALGPRTEEDGLADGYEVAPGLPTQASLALAAALNADSRNRPVDAWRFLERLEELRPACRLEPALAARKYKLAARLKRPRLAARLVRRLLLLNPPPNIAADARLYLAQQAIAAGDKAQGRRMLKELVDAYPATAAALQAEKLLAE